MTIKTTPPRFGQKGFTLIEIVMVLVLLGILAAVAIPKYFDLQEEAEKQAVYAVGAEYQAQQDAAFAEKLLAGESCDKAYSYLTDVFNVDFLKGQTVLVYLGLGEGENGETFPLYVNIHPETGWDNHKSWPTVTIHMPKCHD